jgi:soluble lytic murein transglycosylase-like protein
MTTGPAIDAYPVEVVRRIADQCERFRSELEGAARSEGVPARLVATIGWCETRLTPGSHNSIAYSMFGLMPATASNLAGRTVSIEELSTDHALSARLCARYLARAAKTLGLDVSSGESVPLLASAYNAGYGTGKLHDGPNRFRLRFDPGTDGGYLPRSIRTWNAIGSQTFDRMLSPRTMILLAGAVSVGVGTLFALLSGR